jgi:hypothetical protein
MADEGAPWGADVPVSMPQPAPTDAGAVVPMGGMAFTAAGLVHDLTEVDREELLSRGYGPGGGMDGDD